MSTRRPGTRPRLDLSLYLVTDTVLCGDRGVTAVVAEAVAAGVTCVQLRDKTLDDDSLVALGRELRQVLAGTGVPLLVDDRVHLVEPIGADGVHIGQTDMDPVEARRILGEGALIGLSTHSVGQVRAASALPVGTVDYLGMGPVWATATKAGHAPPIGPDGLTAMRAASWLPAVAIGSVKEHNLAELAGSGVDGVAVVSALCAADDPAAATRGLLEALGRAGIGRAARAGEASGTASPHRVPSVLSIAGSDPSGGAGIQADLKAFSALGAHGCAVLTALTAQSTQGVTGIHPVPAAFVREQVETLLADVRLDAVKVGMLGSAEVAREVAALVRDRVDCPVVLDPVMVSTAGSRLLATDAVEAVCALAPEVDLVTPNGPEAAVMLGAAEATTLAEQREQAVALAERLGTRVLLKGGHLAGAESVDVLAEEGRLRELRAPRVDTRNTHGTGCTLSSAIAAEHAHHSDWGVAVGRAKHYLTRALQEADGLDIGAGPGPVHHFHPWW